MVIYILKFSACLLLFMGFYKIFLERESFHKLKRYYLLAALLLASCIPFITFSTYVETTTPLENAAIISNSINTTESLQATYWSSKLPMVLWAIYVVGVLIFGFRFFKHLNQLFVKIKTNINLRDAYFTNVLLKDKISPHTFFKYIFLNKYEFENKLIPKEVLLHEQTHARQLHAIDILFVEIIHILFWFNPLIYLIKKDIKLNHEFLADQSVLKGGIKPSVYQELLLAFSSSASESKLANAINYSLIKKRFTVMKTQTSNSSTWIKSIALIPLLAFMIYGFSSTKEIIKITEDTTIDNSDYTARSISIQILEDGTYLIDDKKATKNSFMAVVRELHQDISPEIRNRIMNIHLSSKKQISNQEVWFIYNALKDYGFHRLVSDDQEVVKSKGNTPFKENTREVVYDVAKDMSKGEKDSTKSASIQKEASAAEVKEYNALAKKYHAILKTKQMRILASDVERLKYLYDKMSAEQRSNAQPFPDFPEPPPPPPAPDAEPAAKVKLPPPPPPVPDNATPEQKKKYEKAVKAYKEAAAKAEKASYKKRVKAKTKHKQAAKMAAEEKREVLAESKAKLAEARKLEMEERKAVMAETKAKLAEVRKNEMAESKAVLAEAKMEREQDRRQLSEERKIEMEKRKMEREKAMQLRKEELAVLKELKPPKPPKNPLDHVVEMAKKGATFYLEGRSISSDLAIETIKSNKEVSIDTKGSDSNKPKVYITVGKPVIKD